MCKLVSLDGPINAGYGSLTFRILWLFVAGDEVLEVVLSHFVVGWFGVMRFLVYLI